MPSVFTKLYLHDALQTIDGTGPGASPNAMAGADYNGATFNTNRSADTTIGVSQSSAVITMGDIDAQVYGPAARFISPRLSGAQTVGFTAEKVVAHGAGAGEAGRNTSLIFGIYVWRPSGGGSVVGVVVSAVSSMDPVFLGTTETAVTIDPAIIPTCTQVSAADGDHVITEWGVISTASDPSFDTTLYHDGTTEDSATSNAAYVSIPSSSALVFGDPPAPEPGPTLRLTRSNLTLG